MATKKDLVEAYSFSRRRLVTAFVSGAPGGREVEPARPGRMIVGGVALAVLLIAGGAVAGALTKRPAVDWDQPGLVTDDHGALYVILEEDQFPGQPRLRPVINVTSAQLILGADVKTKSVPDDELAKRNEGPPIGILDAPATVPNADQLINTGWTSCTATGQGLKTEVADRSAVTRTPDLGFVVRTEKGDAEYLIAEAVVPGSPLRAYSYALPPDNDGLRAALNVSARNTITVPDEWLALFPVGAPLTADGLGLAGWGKPAGLQGYPGAKVGDVVVNQDGKRYAVSTDGLAEMSAFADAVLTNTPLGKRRPKDFDAVPESFDITATIPDGDAHWPGEPVAASPDATDQLCGVLETEEGEQPAVRLATTPDGSGMLDGIEEDDSQVAVLSGRGAVVRSAGWLTSSGGSIHLIDDRGRSNSVAGAKEVEKLGYADVDAVIIPDSWNKLFQAGADLSVLAALCPPTSSPAADGATDTAMC